MWDFPHLSSVLFVLFVFFSSLNSEKITAFKFTIIFRRLGRFDRMSIPPSGQRVPYVIVYGEPGRPLFHSVRSPQEVLEAQYPKGDTVGLLRPNTLYYISKVIVPALNRCFSLIGADVMKWSVERFEKSFI
jgi:DNA polymerase zeta